MKIKWLAHASFLIEGDGLRIITDPYDPKDINVPPVTETADIVIRSSDDDIAHAYVETIPEGFHLVTATEIVDSGITVKGLSIDAIWSQESLVHKEVPKNNAIYCFTVEGIKITHMGDAGNPLSDIQIEALAGTDILLALAGGPPTIELDDLFDVIQRINPKVIIPMHYRIPGPEFFMLPVTDFTSYFPSEAVVWHDESEVEFSSNSLPDEMRVIVLKPTHFNE